MTAPDPVQLTAPLDPAAYGQRTKLFSASFWAVIAFGVLCIVAGAGVVTLGPKLFPVRSAARPASAPTQAANQTVDQRLADIQAKLQAQQTAAVSPPTSASSQVDALTARVEKLEADRRRVAGAAAGALAAASLSEAADASRPFAGELNVLEASLPDSPDLRALRPLSETGAPTLSALASEYPDVAASAAVASRARARGTGIFARIAQAFAAILTVRRVDSVTGKGVDAVLARAQRDVDSGDLAGALGELNALPPAGQDAVAAWRARAQRRVEIDRRVAGIRAGALAALNRAAGEGSAP